jgi:hypothetical protein
LYFNSELSFLIQSPEAEKMDAQEIYQAVQKHYSSAAKSSSDKYANNVAKAFGYSEEELSILPDGANLGLSCGNPIAIGSLKEVSSQPKRRCIDNPITPLPAGRDRD